MERGKRAAGGIFGNRDSCEILGVRAFHNGLKVETFFSCFKEVLHVFPNLLFFFIFRVPPLEMI